MIVCAAVVGPQSNPLYLESYNQTGQDTVQFHYLIHSALDAVEEKVSAGRKVPGEVPDPHLGIIYPTQDFKVYAYVTNTKVKFFLVLDDGPAKDDEVRLVFKRMHTAYVDAVSNPFYTANTPITSSKFDASVRTIITTLGTA